MIKFNTFIEQNENNSTLNKFYEILTFTEYILKELEQSGEIELVHFQKWQVYIKNFNLLKQNSNKLDNTVIIEEIQKIEDKILKFIANLKEYEFISDFFKIENKLPFSNEENTNFSENKFPYDKYYKIINSVDKKHDTFNNLSDVLSLTSREFLKEKLNLDEEQIQNLKGKENEEQLEKENKNNKIQINEKLDKDRNFEQIASNQKLNQILKIKSDLPQKTKTSSLFLDDKLTSHNLDKEMEEEINNEIFSYTRNMKNYARNFGEILTTDNKKLTKIEKIQEKDKILTDNSMKKLKEFQYDLKIGFFKLILMFVLVIGTFLLTMVVIRVFPKLVK